ncbi:hypothetical protein PC39_00560 [Salinisphaera sp. PC39]
MHQPIAPATAGVLNRKWADEWGARFQMIKDDFFGFTEPPVFIQQLFVVKDLVDFFLHFRFQRHPGFTFIAWR